MPFSLVGGCVGVAETSFGKIASRCYCCWTGPDFEAAVQADFMPQSNFPRPVRNALGYMRGIRTVKDVLHPGVTAQEATISLNPHHICTPPHTAANPRSPNKPQQRKNPLARFRCIRSFTWLRHSELMSTDMVYRGRHMLLSRHHQQHCTAVPHHRAAWCIPCKPHKTDTRNRIGIKCDALAPAAAGLTSALALAFFSSQGGFYATGQHAFT